MMTQRRLKRFLLSGLAVGLMMAAGQAGAGAPYDAAAWRSDYAQLKVTIQKEYANLAWFGSPQSGVNLPRLDQRTRAGLAAARTDGDARQVLEQFVGAFHDGHFSVLPTRVAAESAKVQKVGPHPFDATDPVGTCASLGFLPLSPNVFSLPFETLPNFKLTGDGLQTVYRAGIATTADGTRIGIIRIHSFFMRGFPAACTLGWAGLVKDGKPLSEDAVLDAADSLWITALRDQIAALKSAGVSVLLIDVGSNRGGDDSGDLFPRFFTDKPVRSAPLMMVASPTGAQYFDEQLSGLDDALKGSPSSESTAALETARSYFVHAKSMTTTPCDLSWVWREQRSWTGPTCKRVVAAGYAGGAVAGLPRFAYNDQTVAYHLSLPSRADDLWAMWTGPVYVLTDAKTYSSAEMFAAVMQDNAIGKTVGVTTGGDGCGFMVETEPLVLSHSHMRVRMPNCIRLRRDGSNEVAGIAPDLSVLPMDGEDDRNRADRALRVMSVDLKATR